MIRDYQLPVTNYRLHEVHIPVLFDEVMAALQPRSGSRYLDCTLGGGGHTEGLLRASAPAGQVLAMDADPAAIERMQGKWPASRLTVRQCWLDEAAGIASASGFVPLDGVLMDLGLSSFQLDEAARGFAFMRAGPLDMRFDPTRGESAAQLIDRLDVEEMVALLRRYGDVQNARRVAEVIWRARPITTTAQLRDAVANVTKTRSSRIHPATQVFQALRIAVNDEVGRLERALPALIGLLKPGGRMAVITFHSLEDRIVKDAFRLESRNVVAQPGFGEQQEERQARVRLVNKDPITPAEKEVAANPRSRSAKLRVVERLLG